MAFAPSSSMHASILRISNSSTGRALLRRGIAGPRMVWMYLLLAAALWIFAGIAEDVVTNDSITVIDQQVSTWLHAHASPQLTRITLAFTHAHGTIGILCMTMLCAIFLLRREDWFWLATLVIGVAGSALLNVTLKQIFQRARPVFEQPLLSLLTYSFPSGHTAGATAFYGVVAAYCIVHIKKRSSQATILFAATTMIVLVGLSRMYLGVHFLSDVLAAVAQSCAWLALTFLVCEFAYARLCKINPDQRTAAPRP